MVSPLDFLNRSGGGRQVTVYAPGRGLPRRAPGGRRPAPTRRTNGPRPTDARRTTTGADWNAVEQAFAGARQRKQEDEQEQAAQDKQPWYRKGLGVVLSNPVVRTALQPLEAIDFGRRAAVLGVSEAAEALPDDLERGLLALPPPLNAPFAALASIDEERVAGDERSNVEKLRDPTYGFGDIAHQTGNRWVDRGVGLAGDVALDPTSYLTLGAGRLAKGAGDLAIELPLHAGRGARASQLADLSRRLPAEQVASLAPDIQRAGVRGLSNASPALREAAGFTPPQLRFMGMGIPQSQRLAEPLARAGGAVRANTTARINNPLARGPKGLEPALSTLTRGTNEMEVPKALTNVALSEDLRLGEGAFTTRGNRAISQTYRDTIKGMDRPAIEQMVRDTEAGLDTPLRKFFAETVPSVYKDVSGKDISPYMLEGYFPHMLTGSARRMLRKQLDKGDPVVRDLQANQVFFTDDLLEGSPHLSKSRKLRPNPDGSPRTLEIGGKEVTIAAGTLDEINAEMTKLFPGFKGKFYEDDPIKVMESYVSSVARQAGRDKAMPGLAAGPTPYIQSIEGDLATELADRNDQLARRNPMVAEIDKGFTPGAPLRDVPEPSAPVEPTNIFRSKEMTGKTTERNEQIKRRGSKYRKAAKAEARELRDTSAAQLRDVRQNMMAGLKDEAKVDTPRIKALDKVVQGHNETLARLGPYRAETHDNLQAFIVGIRSDIAELEDEVRRTRSVFKGKLTKEQNRIERKLRASLETMREVQARAMRNLESGPKEAAEAARKRIEQLMRPVEKTKATMRAKAKEIPGVNPERLEWARGVIDKVNAGRADKMRTEYGQALERASKLRRANTKLTQEAKDDIETARILQAALAAQADEIAQMRLALGGKGPTSEPFDQAWLEKETLRQQANLSEGEARRRSTLDRAFRQGGRFYEEKRARDIIKEHAAWEQQVAFHTRVERKQAQMAEQLVKMSPEFQMLQTMGDAALRRAQQDAQAKTARLAAEEAAVARMDDPTRTPPLGNRPGFNEERDITAVVRNEFERGTIMDELVERHDVATSIRDGVLEDTRERLNLMDAEITQTQYNLQNDMAERSSLEAKRAAARERLSTMKSMDPKAWRGEVELDRYASEALAVARSNPAMDDDSLTATESLLSTVSGDLERSRALDIRAKDVERLVDAAYSNKLAPIMLTTVNDGWRMLHDGPLQAGDTIVDAELYRRYEMLYEGMKDPKMGGRVLNGFTNLFKTYATLTPGFHVRNGISAWFMNTSDGVPQLMQLEGIKRWQEFMAGGEEYLARQSPDVQAAFEVAMGSGAGGRFTESGVASSSDNRIYNAMSRNRATRWSQRQGERVEGGVRLGMALHSIRRGETPEGALARVTRIHFDYGQVSKLDEQAKRLIPFWTFMSRNMPMQVTQMWTKPRIYARYNSLVRNFSEEPEPYTPQYWLDAGAWNTGAEPGGLPLYLQPDLAHSRLPRDFADIEEFLSGENPGGILSNVNPFISAPIEFATKRDVFTGQEFGPDDYSDMGGVANLPVNIAANILGQTNEAGQVSDNFANFARSINPLQDRLGRLAPQAAGGDEEAKLRQAESIARFLGVPVRTLTPKQQRSEYFRRYYDALEEYERQQKMLTPTGS